MSTEPSGEFPHKSGLNPLQKQHHRWNPDFLQVSHRLKAVQSLGLNFSVFEYWPTLGDYNKILAQFGVCNSRGHPLQCIPSGPKPRSRIQRHKTQPYEVQVLEFGLIPTRLQNWHDLCNMLAWCRFPKTKATLNLLQARPHGVTRNRYQELMTMFDEGGVIHLYQDQGETPSRQLPAIHFGHALQEADLVGYQNSDGFSLRVAIPWPDFDINANYFWIDQQAAHLIASSQLTKQLD